MGEQSGFDIQIAGLPGPRANAITYDPAGGRDPSSSDGQDGDYWINQVDYTLFGPKAAGAWPAGVSLTGSADAAAEAVIEATALAGNALGSANAAHTDRLAADADAAATAGDRVATAADRVVVRGDKIATDTNAANSATSAGSAATHDTAAGSSASAAATEAADAAATRVAIQALIDGFPGSAGQTIPVATRTAMKAISNPTGSFYLYEAGREGEFVQVLWSDVSADAANDTAEGYYVQSTADPTKGFKRRCKIITPFHFGAVGNNVTNDRPALQAFNTFVFSAPRNEFADWSGRFGISGNLIIGPTAIQNDYTIKYPVGGTPRFKQLVPTFESVRVRNLGFQEWRGGMVVIGLGSTAFSSRTCGVGLAFENCGNCRFTGMITVGWFWFAGIHTPTVNNDSLSLPHVRTYYCGSGMPIATGSLTASWSGSSNTGTSGSPSQSTTISNVTAFPDPAITTYEPIGGQQLHVRIGGYPYFVNSYDPVAGTINFYPHLHPTVVAAAAGTLEWIIGGGFVMTTSDGNIIKIGHHQAIGCGRGLSIGSLYGPRVDSANYASCGTGVAIGRIPSGACIGTSIDALYVEGNVENIVTVPRFAGGFYHYINSNYEIDLSKVLALGDPRLSSGDIAGGVLGETASWTGLMLAYKGRLLEHDGRNIALPDTSPVTFADQRRKARVHTQHRDSQTVNLAVQGIGSFNRLFGNRGSNWRYVGTGSNGAPTGTFTFNPPTLAWSSGVPVSLVSGSPVVKVMGSTVGMSAGMVVTGTGIPDATTILSVDSATQITLSANATATTSISLVIAGGQTTSGSAIVTLPSTVGMAAGMPISGTGIPAATTILSVDSATQITLSANATATGTPALTVTGSVNGAFAAAVFSGFNGPADFSINHTDQAQIVWSVHPLAGWVAPLIVESTTSVGYTLVLADRGKHKRFSSASSKTVTVPPNSSIAFQIGDMIDLEQSGTGLLSVAAGAGVTIRSRGSLLNAAGQYAVLRLRKAGTDEWVLSGDRA